MNVLLSDVNECQLGSFSCPANAVCVNVPGSYTCKCIGYVGDGKSNCKGKVFWFFKCYYQSVVFIVTKYLSLL